MVRGWESVCGWGFRHELVRAPQRSSYQMYGGVAVILTPLGILVEVILYLYTLLPKWSLHILHLVTTPLRKVGATAFSIETCTKQPTANLSQPECPHHVSFKLCVRKQRRQVLTRSREQEYGWSTLQWFALVLIWCAWETHRVYTLSVFVHS